MSQNLSQTDERAGLPRRVDELESRQRAFAEAAHDFAEELQPDPVRGQVPGGKAQGGARLARELLLAADL